VIRPTRLEHPDVAQLDEIVQDYYRVLYGGPDSSPMDPDEFAPPTGGFVLGYCGGEAVAMGGWRFLTEPLPAGMARPVELKRMFVRPEVRGRGFGRRILEALESGAARAGADWILLQTGAPQTVAVALYRRAGYADVAPFGHYASKAGVLHLGRKVPPAPVAS